MTLTFDYCPSDSKHRTIAYFAFCFPYSYTECQKYLSKIDKRMTTPSQPGHTLKDSIYYNRQLLCHSLDGLKIDLLTISSHHGITMETEPHLPGLYPDSSLELPRVFRDKQVHVLKIVTTLWLIHAHVHMYMYVLYNGVLILSCLHMYVLHNKLLCDLNRISDSVHN